MGPVALVLLVVDQDRALVAHAEDEPPVGGDIGRAQQRESIPSTDLVTARVRARSQRRRRQCGAQSEPGTGHGGIGRVPTGATASVTSHDTLAPKGRTSRRLRARPRPPATSSASSREVGGHVTDEQMSKRCRWQSRVVETWSLHCADDPLSCPGRTRTGSFDPA